MPPHAGGGRLKGHKTGKIKFDSLDMENFETFFSELYDNKHKTLTAVAKDEFLKIADELNCKNIKSTESIEMDSPITLEEVKKTIDSLKSGKASSDDMIVNELLKLLNDDNISLLTDLLNYCYDNHHYPWNTNIITPLHKKGSKDDPDNYRAISVSSVIGKLFSAILLNRFIIFRSSSCPDPPNQLGFTKNAQTYDHILTLQTISDKYKYNKAPVYATFVDFKKAFDSVSREALFLKLSQVNCSGKFYDILRDMYGNSIGRIKLAGHLSNPFSNQKRD